MNSINYNIDERQVKEIVDIFLTFTHEVRQERLLDMLLFKMMGLSNADASTLYILEDNQLLFHIMKNISLDISEGISDVASLPPIELNHDNIQNIAAYSAIRQETVVVEDVRLDARFNYEGTKAYDKLTGYRTKSMIVFPLISYRANVPKIIGVVQLINPIDHTTGRFLSVENSIQLPLLKGLSYMLANTLCNILQTEKIKSLYDLSIMDSLTGLGNRRHFNNVFSREWSLSMRQVQPISFLVMDIDHFKLVNDNYGHIAGDKVLKTVATILKDSIRSTDYCARWGGEEFAAILIDTELAHAIQVAEKIRQAVAKTEFDLGNGNKVKITISIGVNATVVTPETENMISFISDTDAALYEAKKTGRNRVCWQSNS